MSTSSTPSRPMRVDAQLGPNGTVNLCLDGAATLTVSLSPTAARVLAYKLLINAESANSGMIQLPS